MQISGKKFEIKLEKNVLCQVVVTVYFHYTYVLQIHTCVVCVRMYVYDGESMNMNIIRKREYVEPLGTGQGVDGLIYNTILFFFFPF